MLIANPDVPCLRNLQRLIDAIKLAGVVGERLKIVLNRSSEFGVLSTAQIERVLGLNIDYSVGSDYRTVASAVNSGVPVSDLKDVRAARAARRDRAQPGRPEAHVGSASRRPAAAATTIGMIQFPATTFSSCQLPVSSYAKVRFGRDPNTARPGDDREAGVESAARCAPVPRP